jgi:hypothetical protein
VTNPNIALARTNGTDLAKRRSSYPHLGAFMFGICKRQQQQEETSLCATLVVFNLALLSLFIFICVK